MRKTSAGLVLAVVWPLGISGCAAILGIEEQTFDGGDGSDSGAGTEAASPGPDGRSEGNMQPHDDATTTVDGTMAMHDAEDARQIHADSPSEAVTGLDASPDVATPQDTGGAGSPDTSTPETSTFPPPPADGGCSSGATVFVATDPGSVTTTGSYGNFNTTGPVCVELMGGITGQLNGWGGNNMAGRTLTLNGTASTATMGTGVLPPGPSGYAIWEWSAGTDSYAGMDFY